MSRESMTSMRLRLRTGGVTETLSEAGLDGERFGHFNPQGFVVGVLAGHSVAFLGKPSLSDRSRSFLPSPAKKPSTRVDPCRQPASPDAPSEPRHGSLGVFFCFSGLNIFSWFVGCPMTPFRPRRASRMTRKWVIVFSGFERDPIAFSPKLTS